MSPYLPTFFRVGQNSVDNGSNVVRLMKDFEIISLALNDLAAIPTSSICTLHVEVLILKLVAGKLGRSHGLESTRNWQSFRVQVAQWLWRDSDELRVSTMRSNV